MHVRAQPVPTEGDRHRNRLELIRFASPEERRQAIRVLLESGTYAGSASDPNVWTVRTEVVRTLLAAKVPFEWLTRNLE